MPLGIRNSFAFATLTVSLRPLEALAGPRYNGFMHYWLDGYNIIFRERWNESEGSLEAARDKLLRSLGAIGAKTKVYFDASRSGGGISSAGQDTRGVKVVYVQQSSADDAMVADLRAGSAQGVVLVTDDRELRIRAKQLGASSVGSRKFLERLQRGSSPQGKSASGAKDTRQDGVSKRKVDDWLDYFDIDENWTPEDDQA